MNYFAHAYRFLENPYFVAGTGVPDWLSVVDRQIRIRARHAAPFADDLDSRVAAVARGILQHLRDDARFHETRAFAQLSLELTILAREVLDMECGLRPGLLGHLLVELLLDAGLIGDNPERLEQYYRVLESADAGMVEQIVNRMAPRPSERLAAMISGFRAARVLSDYAEDGKLLVRLNQIMRRVGLAELPARFREILPEARRRVNDRRHELLAGSSECES